MQTRSQFEVELQSLRNRLLEMGSEVDRMLELAIRALTEQDIELAQDIIRSDDAVDRTDVEIELMCMRLIALQQPVARDLRLIGTALKAIADLERVGDYAVDIAKIGRRIAKRSFYKPLIDIPHLAELVRQMLRDMLTAFVNHDLGLADKVIQNDDQVDTLFHQQRDYLIERMQQDSSIVYLATYVLFAAKYLERAADHIVNVAERLHYIETGELHPLAQSHKPTS